MKFMKKILSLLSVLLTACIVSCAVSAAKNDCTPSRNYGTYAAAACNFKFASSTGDETLKMLSFYIGGFEPAGDLSSMTAVGAVILNRCADDRFPDTVSANGASLGILPTMSPNPMAEYAAMLALSGVDPTSGALAFYKKGGLPPGKSVVYSASGIDFVK